MDSKSPIGAALRLGSRAPCEITLHELFNVFEVDNSLGALGRAVWVFRTLEECGFELTPGMAEGDFDTARVLRNKAIQTNIQAETLKLIEQGESHSLEFKSSLAFDHKRFHATGHGTSNPASEEFRSAGVTHSALKTIAAFLNSDGGTLIIGLDDNGNPIGIEWDYPAVGGEQTNGRDKWELHFGNLIKARFLDGSSVLSYTKVTILNISEKAIARVDVTPRTKLSFLQSEKQKDNLCCYRRAGNSTVTVEIFELEEFLDKRRIRAEQPVT